MSLCRTMFKNKQLLCSLLIYRFNIGCMSQQCSRNLSFTNAILQKLKVKAEKEVLEIEYKGDIKDTYSNAQYCETTITTSSQISMPPRIGTESKQKFQESINYEIYEQNGKKTFTVSNNPAIDKIIPINTLTTVQDEKKTPFVDDTEKISSYPILGSRDVITKPTKSKMGSRIPSVSTILRETMPLTAKTALELWRIQMIEKVGQEEFTQHCKEILRTGKLLHDYIQNVLQYKDVPLLPEIELAFHSVRPFLSKIQKIQMVETYVTHPNLMYRGIVDCIAIYRDELCVIDWKKSDRRRLTLASTYDAPLQVCAYIGAVNASHLLPFMVTKGLVVIAYTNGDHASVYEIENDMLQTNWENWLKRLKEYYENPKNRSFTEA